MSELIELAERVEAASADEQRQLIIEASWAIGAMGSGPRLMRMLNVRAFESAALSLVPEGWVRGVEEWPDPTGAHSRAWLKQTSTSRIGRKEIWGHADDDIFIEVKDAATPALALTAACLRARAALTTGDGE